MSVQLVAESGAVTELLHPPLEIVLADVGVQPAPVHRYTTYPDGVGVVGAVHLILILVLVGAPFVVRPVGTPRVFA